MAYINSPIIKVLCLVFVLVFLLGVQQKGQIFQSHAASTTLSFTVFLHGIGHGGDSTSPSSGGNTSPNVTQQTISVGIFNAQNVLVASQALPVTYNATAGDFTGSAAFSSLSSGSYLVAVRADKYLQKTVDGIQTITSGTTNQIPPVSLIAGDIDNNNQINIADFNILMGCYSDLAPATSCTSAQKTAADLTDDGHVNQLDYNLFIREISNRAGEGAANPTVVLTPKITIAPTTQQQPTTRGCPLPLYPNASCTGVPSGTTLTTYNGPCSITAANTIIDAKTVNCSLDIKAANVMIKNSKVNGILVLDTDLAGSNKWSFTLQDSEVNGGAIQQAAVSAGNMVVLRSNIYGGQTSVQCEEKSVSCKIQDSWLHGQYIPTNGNWHLGGFLSDGGSNMQLIHNSVVCDHPVNPLGEGCTGDINLIPNFATISNVLIQNNLFGANVGSAYCTYGGEKSTSPYPHANNVTYRDNVFQRGTNNKCASYGPVTDFNSSGVGNQWINNTWNDGTPVAPAN